MTKLKLSAGAVGGFQPKVLLTDGHPAVAGTLPVAAEAPQALLDQLDALNDMPLQQTALQTTLRRKLYDE